MSDFFNLGTDVTLGGNSSSDFVAPSQKAVQTYVDNAITNFHVCVTMTGSIDQYDDTLITISSASHTGSQVSALLAEGKVVVVKLTISPADFYLTYVDGGYGHFECMYEGMEYIVRWDSTSDMWTGEMIKINDRLTTAESNITTLQYHDAWPHHLYTSRESYSSHTSTSSPFMPANNLPSPSEIEGGDIYLIYTSTYGSTGNSSLYLSFAGIQDYFNSGERTRQIHVILRNLAANNNRTINISVPGMGDNWLNCVIPRSGSTATRSWGGKGADIWVMGRTDTKTGLLQFPATNNAVETHYFTWN